MSPILPVMLITLMLTSCVSKRQYTSVLQDKASCSREYQQEITKANHVSDSLRMVIVQKDSIIDTLTMRIAEAGKKERTRVAAISASSHKSTMSREQEYEKKALFIYNFTKFIEWPVEYNGTEFVIGVVGDDAVIRQMVAFMNDKKTFGKKIIVKPYKKGPQYNIIYVTTGKSSGIATLKNDAKHNKTVIITDEENVQGAHITFSVDEDKIRYNASKANIEKLGLKVAQELMRYSG